MSESHTLFRLVIFIGFVLLFSSVVAQPWVFVGQPVPENSTWGRFSSGIQNFPNLYNPFDGSGAQLTYQLNFAHGGSGYETRIKTNGSANGCSQSSYWNCIIDPNGPDGNASFIEVTDDNSGPGEFLSLNTTGWPGSGTIRSGVLVMSCRSNMTVAAHINVVLHVWISNAGGSGNSYLTAIDSNVYCKVGAEFTNTTIQLIVPDAIYDLNAVPNILQMWILGPFNTSFHVSSLRFTAVISNTISCSGGDFFSNVGCSIAQAAQVFWNFIVLLGSGIAFGLLVIAWFVSMIGLFFGAVLSIANMPGAPPLVTGILGILIVGSLFFIAIVIMGKIHPGSPT